MTRDVTLPQAVIFDFDGTFCDVRKILQYLDRDDKNLVAFHEATHLAPHNQNVFDLLDDVKKAGITPILVSVRGEMWRDITVDWLSERDFVPDIFHMRADDDDRPHAEVKREILNDIKREFNVIAAVDDDPKNKVMFEEEDINFILVPGYNGIDDPAGMVVPEWWDDLVRSQIQAPFPASSLPVPERAYFKRSGATCQLPVKSAQEAPCILRVSHKGRCRSR